MAEKRRIMKYFIVRPKLTGRFLQIIVALSENLNFNNNFWIEFLGGNSAASQAAGGSTGSQATFYNMERDMEDNLLRRINELHRAQLEPLVKFLPLILDKLLLLMVKPPAFDGHILNVGPAAFNAIAMIVNKLTSSVSPFTLLTLLSKK